MQNWYDRFKKIREKYKMSQSELGRAIGKDSTQISRYERGAVKKFPNAIYKLLQEVFTLEEVKYVETGDETIRIDNNFGICKVEENNDIYCDLPKDSAMIMELLHELTREQRRDVLRFMLDMDNKQG